MSGVTTSSLSLAWSLRNWLILDYEEANGQTVRPWAPFLLLCLAVTWFLAIESEKRLADDGQTYQETRIQIRIWIHHVVSWLEKEKLESRKEREGETSVRFQFLYAANNFLLVSGFFFLISKNYWPSMVSSFTSQRNFSMKNNCWLVNECSPIRKRKKTAST